MRWSARSIIFCLAASCHAVRQTEFDLGKELATGDVSSHIWNGVDVKIEDKGFGDVGPFPAMVALIFKTTNVSNANRLSFCGGTLYKRKYILTAGHCVTNDPKQYELYAYLNPYINPRTAHTLYVDSFGSDLKLQELEDGSEELVESLRKTAGSDERENQVLELKRFQDGIKRGLNKRLNISSRMIGPSHFGLLHKSYGQDKQKAVPTYDVALIELSEPPYAEDSKWWQVLDVDLPQSPPEATQDKPAAAMMYGNGIANPEKEVCGFNWVPRANCILQQKKIDILDKDTCRNYMLHDKWRIFSSLLDLPEATLQQIAESQPEVKEGKKTASEMIQKLREQGSDLNDALTHSGKNATEPAVTRDVLDVDEAKQTELTRLWQETESELEGFKAGRQLCIMSSERTGNVQSGDSGGPLVTEDGKTLLGITGWGVMANGGANLLAVPDGTKVRMPGFYASTAYFRTSIDAAVKCLSEGKEDCELHEVNETTQGEQQRPTKSGASSNLASLALLLSSVRMMCWLNH